MRPANCNMKQLTHLESKKKKNPFVQYVTNIKESTFLVVSTESLFKLCETFSQKMILSLCLSQGIDQGLWFCYFVQGMGTTGSYL